ncbi:MAG: tRNA lysidine(34) synthetase TilS [Alphaproteobacteria bacterium]|nr:tRNA lysidine(34) synthetase TilS [Alphaproteobacteria bacterium]
MAALLLTLDWCKKHGLPTPQAVTVDHSLRKESRAEAQRVGRWMQKLGVAHQTLTMTWTSKPEGNVQAVAREMRYALLGHWARAEGVKTLITGHTIDDQAETFLIRLARGSGLDGLSGMAARSQLPWPMLSDIALLRPLLSFSHGRLVATLRSAKQSWIEDPSNASTRFTRAKLRAAWGVLEGAGLSSERLAETAAHLRRAREAIDVAVDRLLLQDVVVSDWGYAMLGLASFREAPPEVSLRALGRIATSVGGEAYPPRFEAMEALLAWLVEGHEPRGRTLGGCRFVRRNDGTVLVAREAAAVGADVDLRPGASAVWDGRFRVALAAAAPMGAVVKALGPEGLALAGDGAVLPPVEPHLIAATSPALWTGAHVIAAPLVQYFAPEAGRYGFSANFLGLAKGKGAAKRNSL